MKHTALLATFCLIFQTLFVKAQAPAITYPAGAKTFTTGVPIPTLTPANTGGAVPQTLYGQVTTFAGTGKTGYTDGTAASAAFKEIKAMCMDAKGNIFVADEANHVIRKITPGGEVSTFAGGEYSYRDGIGTAAAFTDPKGITIDQAGNLYVLSDNRIRKITPDAVVTTLAGGGPYGPVNGTGSNASFGYLLSIAVDAAGNLYVTDYDVSAIRKITPQGEVTTYAGDLKEKGSTNGTLTNARFSSPSSLTFDKKGNLYVSDYNVIRMITPQGVVSTFAAGAPLVDGADAINGMVAEASGKIYYSSNNTINIVTPDGKVSSVAGIKGTFYTNPSKYDGVGAGAEFKWPAGMVLDGKGNMYMADTYNYQVRKMVVTGYAISNRLPSGLNFDVPTGAITGFPTEATAATDYVVTAYNAAGSSQYTLKLTTVANTGKPVITSFSPQAAPIGAVVTLKGNNLVNTSRLVIGGSDAIVLSNTNTEIAALVMPNTTTGSISLTTNNGYATSATNFKVLAPYTSYVQQGNKLTSAALGSMAAQGITTAVSADGNTALVGASNDNGKVGSAIVYTRSGSGWVIQARLAGNDAVGQSAQGTSVALTADGNMAVVGGKDDNNGTGATWIFKRTGSSWVQQGRKLFTPAATQYVSQGNSVAISANGNTIAVGCSFARGVYSMIVVYDWVNGAWVSQSLQIQTGYQTDNKIALSADGQVVAMSLPHDAYNGTGSVMIYLRNTIGGWYNPFRAEPGKGAEGSLFGSTLAISGNGKYVTVGAPNYDGGAGAVWVFKSDYVLSPYWGTSLMINGKAADGTKPKMFGRLVGSNADASVLAISDVKSNSATEQIRIFKQDGDKYVQQGDAITRTGLDNATYYGNALAISADGSAIVTGNHFDAGGTGAIWMYKAVLLPEATTLAATDITQSTAVIKGTINGNGATATINFEYGIKADLADAKSLPADGKSIIEGTQGTVAFTAKLSGLSAGVTYYYRINAVSPQGKISGEIQKFLSIPGQPAITTISPLKGAIGTLITVTGTNLISPKNVMIAGAPALVVSATGDKMLAMVMPGATTGGTQVTTAGGSTTGNASFTVINTSVPNNVQQNIFNLDSKYTNNSYSGSNTAASISADGNTALFIINVDRRSGESGLYIYKRSGSSWQKESENLCGPNTVIYSAALSADGNTALFTSSKIVSDDAPTTDGIKAMVYIRKGTTWAKQSDLAFNSNNGVVQSPFKVALSADGNTAIIGITEVFLNSGVARIFKREGDVWAQQGSQLVCQGSVGTDSQVSVAISADGNTAAIGQRTDNNRIGATWIFTKNTNGVWAQQGAKLVGTGFGPYQEQGSAIALNADGNVLAVGGESSYSQAYGAAWVFTRTGNVWKQQGEKITPVEIGEGDHFGSFVDLSADGNIMLSGVENYKFGNGAVATFKRSGDIWKQIAMQVNYDYYPTSFGFQFDMSPDGKTMIAGAIPYYTSQAFVRVFTAEPILTTLNALDINGTGATVAGTVDDNGSNAAIIIKYREEQQPVGSETSVSVGSLTAGAGLSTFKTVLKGLKMNTSYIYQISAVTATGTYDGEVKTLVTTQAPVIYDRSPLLAQVGTTVTITGINFTGVTEVKFGDITAAKFKVVSANTILAVIAAGTVNGQISVKNAYGTAINNGLKIFGVPVIDTYSTVIWKYGESTLTTPGVAGYKYQWIKDGVAIADATANSYTAKEAGSYKVKVSVDSLSQTSLPIVMQVKLKINDDTFTVMAKDVTCRGSIDGTVTVKTYATVKFNVEITGKGFNRTSELKNYELEFKSLEAGTYDVCITTDEDKDFKRCFTAVVNQPADLSLLSFVNEADKTVLLSLSGGTEYHIMLNGVMHNTTQNNLLLPLAEGKNTLNISTDKLCQGVIERIISLSPRLAPYPNPFNEVIEVPIGDKPVRKATVQIFSVKGILLISKQVNNPSNTISVQTSQIDVPGSYTLILDTDGKRQVYKIIKK